MPKLLFATTNLNKAKEVRAEFAQAGLDFDLLTNRDLPQAPAVAETGTTFQEDATLKAHALATFSGLPTLADDSGLCVDYLHGAPGVYSARYAKDHDDAANNAKLLQKLAGVPLAKRTASFQTVMVVSWPGHFEKDLVVAGECSGLIAEHLTGPQTFGYDPLFYLPELGKTFAQLSTPQKNALSHRGRALQKLIAQLPTWWQQFK
ncbi:MAG: XTP/dITP diphosphatase [Lactobacillus sp.]